jgi:hypothetical protein
MKCATAGLAALLGLLGSSGSPEPTYAWWLTARFDPQRETIEGIPIRVINSSWTKALVLRAELMPAEASKPGETVAEHGGKFTVDADLDGDRTPERAVVGVYHAKSGEEGRFLLILGASNRPMQARQKRALFTSRGDAGFSVLFWENGRLRWAECLECDVGCEVIPAAHSFSLKCEGCCE